MKRYIYPITMCVKCHTQFWLTDDTNIIDVQNCQCGLNIEGTMQHIFLANGDIITKKVEPALQTKQLEKTQ